MTQQKNGNIIAIITMIFLFGMIAFVTNLAATMGIVLKNQFSVSNALGMLGNLGNFIAYAVMGIPSGILLTKVGYKKTALIAVAIGFIGVGVQYLSGHASPSSAFAVYLCGAFISGFSMCLLNTVVNPMLNKLGGEGNKGNQLIQVGGSFNSVMATITPMFVGILIAGSVEKATISQIFPVMYTAMAVFAFAFFVLLFVNIPEPSQTKSSESIGTLMKGALKFRHFVLGAIAIFVYVGVEVGVPGTLNLFLTDPIEKGGAGISSTISGFVVGTYWLLMLVGRLTSSVISGKVSTRTQLIAVSTTAILFTLIAIFTPKNVGINVPTMVYDPVAKTTEILTNAGMPANEISAFIANPSEESLSAQAELLSASHMTPADVMRSLETPKVPISALFLVLCGLCTSIMWGGIFNLAVEGLGKYTAQASGIFMMMVVGGGIFPLLQQVISDAVGYMASYWLIIFMLAYLLFYGLVGCKNVNKDIPVE